MTTVLPLQKFNKGNYFRAYALRNQEQLIDPFLGIDHAWMSAPTFGPHPHAGFSAVSYVFQDSSTAIENRDSIGNHNLIQPGGLHWAAAGKGIVHEEIPAEAGKTVHSLQIFIALPGELRNSAPFTLTLEPHEVPVVSRPGAKVRVVSGAFGATVSPLKPPTEVTLLDISLEDGTELEVPLQAGQRAVVMPILGSLTVNGQAHELADLKVPLIQSESGKNSFGLHAHQGGAQVMVFAAAPLQPGHPFQR
ncbi:pirin family protein [Enterobacterales bacterium AE_CKDN230030158-1A_HGKHYDSX7]